MLPRGAERPKFIFSCFRVARKDQNSFFHASARRGKAKIRFFMLRRGAERPKFVFSCFGVTRKGQKEEEKGHLKQMSLSPLYSNQL